MRGEHPLVFSLRSRRSGSTRGFSAESSEGELYSPISRTHRRALSMAAPYTNGFGMAGKPFGLGQAGDGAGDPVQSLTRKPLQRNGLHKIGDAQSATVAGHGAGGQNMVRAGGVIARGLSRVIPDKDRAGVAHQRDILFFYCNMLARDAVRKLHGLRPRTGEQNRAVTGKRSPRNFVACGGGPHFPDRKSVV